MDIRILQNKTKQKMIFEIHIDILLYFFKPYHPKERLRILNKLGDFCSFFLLLLKLNLSQYKNVRKYIENSTNS